MFGKELQIFAGKTHFPRIGGANPGCSASFPTGFCEVDQLQKGRSTICQRFSPGCVRVCVCVCVCFFFFLFFFCLDTIDSPEDGLKFFIGTQTDISIGSIYDRVDEWNTAQVCDFLEQRGFDHDPFLQAQVDGLQLMKLSKDELVRLGVANRDYDRFDMFLKLEISYRRALDETLKEDKLKSQ
jgi:hypothetical protein